VRRAPAHAGRLRPWERSVFAMVFALMAAFVVVVTLSAARSGNGPATVAGHAARSPAATSGRSGQAAAPAGAGAGSGVQATGAVPTTVTGSAQLNRQLAAALAVVRRADPGGLAVGVIDETSGTEALYRGGTPFRAGGLAATDLVAALLLQHQREGSQLSDAESSEAAAAIEDGSTAPAAALWHRVKPGLRTANAALRLQHTRPRRPDSWRELTTTVTDQLQLLSDLSAASSPLTSASRDYLLGLMTAAVPGQRWGVPSAASAGASSAVQDGCLVISGRWVADSTGIVDYHGQELMMTVLSDNSRSKASAQALVQAAALAAARTFAGS
jgi:hypothetical protein